MARRPEPTNATHLAAELQAAAIKRYKPRPSEAAYLATELCAIGRSFSRIKVRLTGGSDEWGEHPGAEKRMAAAERRAAALLSKVETLVRESAYTARVDQTGDGFYIVIRTGEHESTVLQ